MPELDRIDRIEYKLDSVANDVLDIKLAFAELKGAKKAVWIVAMLFGALAGVVGSFLSRRTP